MSKIIRVEYQKDGKDGVVVVKKPGHTQITEANMYAASIFNKARQNGVCLRGQIDDWLEEQGLWTKETREKIKKLEENLNEKLEKLAKGKTEDDKKMKLSEARKLAIEIRLERLKLNIIQIQRREYDQYTVEGQTENARFDCLASMCLCDEEGNRLFKSIDEYYDAADEEYISTAASKLANMMFDTEGWEEKLPENSFLFKHGLSDKNGRLINKLGQPVDVEGNLVEETTEEQKVEEPEFENDLV